VHDGHFGAGDRLAVRADDATAEAGGGALRERGRGGENGEQSERQLGQPRAITISHL
jgi:hypothetical protein